MHIIGLPISLCNASRYSPNEDDAVKRTLRSVASYISANRTIADYWLHYASQATDEQLDMYNADRFDSQHRHEILPRCTVTFVVPDL